MLKGIKNAPPRKTRKTWCGPAALSIISGKEYEVCRQRLAETQGGKPTMRVFNWQMEQVLDGWGYRYVRTRFVEPPTLATWLRERSPDEVRALYLVEITGHYLVVQGRKACDSWTKEPVFLKDMPHRRARVHRVWKIVPATDSRRDQFVAAAKRHGATFALNAQGTRLTIKAAPGKTFGGKKSVTLSQGILWLTGLTFLKQQGVPT